MKKFLFIILFLALTPLLAFGTTYHYVHHGLGTGDNNGSSWANAWQDVDTIDWSALSTEAASQPVYVYFKKGVTISNDGITPTAGGSSETNRIFLTTDPGDSGTTPLWSGNTTWTSGWSQYQSTNIYYHSADTSSGHYWHDTTELTPVERDNRYILSEGEWTSWDGTGADQTLYINIGQNPNGENIHHPGDYNFIDTPLNGVNYITIQNMHFSRVKSFYANSGGNVSTHWTFEDNIFEDIGGNTFFHTTGSSNNFILRRNLFDNANGWKSVDDAIGWVSHNTYIENGSDWLIEYNKFVDNRCGGVMWRDNSDDWIVRYNYFENCSEIGGFAGTQEPCISADYQGATSANVEIYGNVMKDVVDGIGIVSRTGTVKVYHNTIYDITTGVGFWWGGGQAATIDFRNNIVFSGAFYVVGGSDTYDTADYNCLGAETDNFYYNSGAQANFTAYQAAASPQEQNSLSDDPLLKDAGNDNLSLSTDSPCIDAAVAISSYNERLPASWQWDVGSEGGKVSPTLVTSFNRTAWDIGAYEFNTGTIKGMTIQ